MALVVLLRGVNVGGHRSLRPSKLAVQLRHLDAVNIGAAGTFVNRRPVGRTRLRAEFAERLPFDAEITICEAQEIVALLSHAAFAKYSAQPEVTRFVTVLSRPPRTTPQPPITLPSHGKWLLRVIARKGRFVVGVYRRHMRVISYLSALVGMFGVSATTRSWNTIAAIAKALDTKET